MDCSWYAGCCTVHYVLCICSSKTEVAPLSLRFKVGRLPLQARKLRDSLCVSCVTGSLIKLDMTQMGLSCEFPYAEMQAFPALTSISFQGNAITGDVETIGASLEGLLGQLTYLDLSFNLINGSFAGIFPVYWRPARQVYVDVCLIKVIAVQCTRYRGRCTDQPDVAQA